MNPENTARPSSTPSTDEVMVRSVSVIAGVVVGLTFIFGFGNVWTLALRLGVPLWVAPTRGRPIHPRAPAGHLLLALHGATPEQLRPARRLLIFASLATQALNIADPIVTVDYGKAAFDSVGPLLLIGWEGCYRPSPLPGASHRRRTTPNLLGWAPLTLRRTLSWPPGPGTVRHVLVQRLTGLCGLGPTVTWWNALGRKTPTIGPPTSGRSRPRRCAEVVFGAADWDSSADKGMHVVRTAGRTRPLTESAVRLTEGVTARHAPGHTPGSYILVVTSGEDSAYLLCDVVHSPLQLTNSGIAFATDADVALATRTRSALLREMEQATAIGMNHISGFHRIPRSWLPAR
jgi:hypothetical protein